VKERAAVNVHGAVHHFAVVLMDGKSMKFVWIECVNSIPDRAGVSRLPQKKCDTECFTSLDGAIRYVNVMAIDALVDILFL